MNFGDVWPRRAFWDNVFIFVGASVAAGRKVGVCVSLNKVSVWIFFMDVHSVWFVTWCLCALFILV